MTIFYLVRHAVTAHTGHKLTGWAPGVHLTEEGRAQADAVADRLARLPIKAVYSSPIDRTRETAAPIAARLNLEVELRHDLGEVQYGKWTNRSMKTLARTKLWTQVQRWPSAARFPDGETLQETQARAVADIAALNAEHPRGAICCVTHAEIIRLVMAHYLGVHIDLFQRIVISPASVSILGIGADGPRVLALNWVADGSAAKNG